MITLSHLKNAAFWGMKVCLDCGAEVPPEWDECVGCESTDVHNAEELITTLGKIEDDRGEGE